MNKKIVILITLTVLLVSPVITLAATDPGAWFNGILTRFLDIVVWPVFFAASVLMLIWAGFLFLTTQGDPGKIVIARKAVLWAVIGIIVAIVAFSAVNIIKSVISPDTTTSPPPSPSPTACTDDLQCYAIDPNLSCNCLSGVPCINNSGWCR